MAKLDDDWQLKFRRVLLLRVGTEAHDWHELLKRYANDVTDVSLDNYYALDYLRLPADCMVVDCRIPDHDITGVGILVATAQKDLLPPLPILLFHDERPGWEPEFMKGTGLWYAGTEVVPYDPSTAMTELEKFLEATPTRNHRPTALMVI